MIRSELEYLYRKETDLKVKERLLLVLRVKNDGEIPAHAAKELHRSKPWASEWLARFAQEGVGGLKDRLKSGRPPKLSPKIAFQIRRELLESKQGWTTKQVNDIIVKKGKVIYHYTHIYSLLHKWGLKQKVPRKKHINTASKEEKEIFKKIIRKY